MIRKLLSLLCLVAVLAAAPVCSAQDETDAPDATEKVAKKKKKKPASPVVKAIKRTKKISGKLNDKADYYILLYSASWCGPCCNEMPHVVKAHKEMAKDKRVEIVLMGCDHTPEGAKAFAKQFGMKFYVTLAADKNAAKVPGHIDPSGIPACVVVDRYGRRVDGGSPHLIQKWKELVETKGEPEPPTED